MQELFEKINNFCIFWKMAIKIFHSVTDIYYVNSQTKQIVFTL